MSLETKDRELPSAQACAEAAAWIARLHGESRTPKLEAGLRCWLAADPTHRVAFEMANDLWEGAERWPKPDQVARRRRVDLAFWMTWPRAVVVAGMSALALVGGALYFDFEPQIATAIGEQRNLTLEDGTRVSLNTATRIRLDYGPEARRVRLEAGEAMFEVARHPGRPFIVTAGDRRITALGTAFLVRRDERQIAVTLMNGKVAVEPVTANPRPGPQREVMAPGDRLVFSETAPPTLDRPELVRVMAWQRNQVIFDHTPLSEAVDEMNRYSPVPLTIETPAAADVEVTGVFRAGDSTSFAQAVAAAYRLQVNEQPQRIVIAGIPVPPER